jgi:hypothetical protein
MKTVTPLIGYEITLLEWPPNCKAGHGARTRQANIGLPRSKSTVAEVDTHVIECKSLRLMNRDRPAMRQRNLLRGPRNFGQELAIL